MGSTRKKEKEKVATIRVWPSGRQVKVNAKYCNVLFD